mmetsp:Transcript_59759/g.109840  ORF Transcript_59759/g.109840 Transcript_59759/m.109840 type:complete len:87 (+) Transcript_59759:241-501(+)
MMQISHASAVLKWSNRIAMDEALPYVWDLCEYLHFPLQCLNYAAFVNGESAEVLSTETRDVDFKLPMRLRSTVQLDRCSQPKKATA